MNDIDKILEQDTDGMVTYDYIVNNVETCLESLPFLIAKLKEVDCSGQFLASTARFLNAVDPETFRPFMTALIEAAIDKDRERKYISALLQSLWGENYEDRVDELNRTDDNFRKIYKRVYPKGI